MPLILPLCISEFVLLELSLFLISLMFLVILALHTVTHLSKNSGCTIRQCNSLLRALYSFYMCSTMSLFLEKVYFIYVKYTSNKPMLIVSDSCVQCFLYYITQRFHTFQLISQHWIIRIDLLLRMSNNLDQIQRHFQYVLMYY